MSTRKKKHLDRNQLFEMARKPSKKQPQHLLECQECRELVNLIKKFDMAGRSSLPDAPNDLVEKMAGLAQQKGLLQKLKRVSAKVVFDSWAIPSPIGVRGQDIQINRRIRYQSNKITFDLHAEYSRKNWKFTAHITGVKTKVTFLKMGKKIMTPDKEGFIHWSSGRPPGIIYLQYDDNLIEFPKLQWTKSKPN